MNRSTRMNQRDRGRRRAGLLTATVAGAGALVAGLLGWVLPTGSDAATTGTTTDTGTSSTNPTSSDEDSTGSQDQLQTPSQAPESGSSGDSHAGSGGS